MTISGVYVATFPYFGGWSPARIVRVIRPKVHAMAAAQGVEITGDPIVRLHRTPLGDLVVVVRAEATTTRPPAEVRAHAEYMATEHESTHPHLAREITEKLEVL